MRIGHIGAAAAALTLAASMRAASEALPRTLPHAPEPPSISRLDPRTRRAVAKKEARRRRQDRNRAYNLRMKRLRPDPHAEFRAAVNALSGWQRNRWARAGYPGLKDKNAEEVLPFVRLIHG